MYTKIWNLVSCKYTFCNTFWAIILHYFCFVLGLCKTKVDFERISGNLEGGDCQLRIVLPYCSKKLKWEVIFDSTSPWFAPDFRFDDDTFLAKIEANFLEEKVPSLFKWNENDPKALSDVLSELISLYKLHHVNKLCNTSKF